MGCTMFWKNALDTLVRSVLVILLNPTNLYNPPLKEGRQSLFYMVNWDMARSCDFSNVP